MNISIYILIDPRNNQVRYVGQSNNPKLRLNKHIQYSKCIKRPNRNTSWIKSLLNENLKPIMEVIDTVPFNEWEFWERHYISLYKTWGFKLNNHTNGGGQVGYNYNQTSEIRALMSKKKKELLAIPENNSMFGKIHTNESKQQMRDKALLRDFHGENNPRARFIIQYDLNLTPIKEWSCAKDCADVYNMSRGNISATASHNMQVDIDNSVINDKINHYKQYIDKDNYDSISLAIDNLKKQLKKYKQVKGFIFKFK